MWLVTGVLGGVLAALIGGVFYQVVRHPPREEEPEAEIKPSMLQAPQEPLAVDLCSGTYSTTGPTESKEDLMEELPFNDGALPTDGRRTGE